MSEKKEMTAVEFLKEFRRMCDDYLDCDDCPMEEIRRNSADDCMNVVRKNPEEAVAIVQKWAEACPMKTLKDDFLEKYPNAPLLGGKTPFACAKYLYPNVSCVQNGHNVMCFECWDRPLEVE